MYTRDSFGSFYPIDSMIHRLNPIIKLVNFVIVLLIVLYTSSIYIVSFIMIFLLFMIIESHVPLRYYFNTFYSFRYIYILVAIICAYNGIVFNTYLVYIFKLIIVFEYINVLSYTTSPSETIYSIDRALSTFNFLYLNVSILAFKINSLLRYHPLYMNTKYSLIKSSSSRGVIYNTLNLDKKFRLYVNTIRVTKHKSNLIMKESKLRLFDIKKRRTNYRTNKVSYYDIFFLLFHLLLLYVCLKDGGKL